jgi:hypothetical protein
MGQSLEQLCMAVTNMPRWQSGMRLHQREGNSRTSRNERETSLAPILAPSFRWLSAAPVAPSTELDASSVSK